MSKFMYDVLTLKKNIFSIDIFLNFNSNQFPLFLFFYSFSTCTNSNSTGVERPKIRTATRKRFFS